MTCYIFATLVSAAEKIINQYVAKQGIFTCGLGQLVGVLFRAKGHINMGELICQYSILNTKSEWHQSGCI